MDVFSPYYDIARKLFPSAKIVLDWFHIVQHLSRSMNRLRIQIMNQLDRKSYKYKAIKRYWKLIQQDSRKLSHKRFYRPTFRMHLFLKRFSRTLKNSENTINSTNSYCFIFKRNKLNISLDSLKITFRVWSLSFKLFLRPLWKIRTRSWTRWNCPTQMQN